jgi:hypothetical protein
VTNAEQVFKLADEQLRKGDIVSAVAYARWGATLEGRPIVGRDHPWPGTPTHVHRYVWTPQGSEPKPTSEYHYSGASAQDALERHGGTLEPFAVC